MGTQKENASHGIRARNAAVARLIAAHKAEYVAVHDEERKARGLGPISEQGVRRVHYAAAVVGRLSEDERAALMLQVFGDTQD